MNTAEIYIKSEDCILEDMDGEILLYNPNTSTTLHLNSSSTIVLELCDGKRSVADIVDVVQQAYPEQTEQVEKDILDVVKDLSTRHILLAQGK